MNNLTPVVRSLLIINVLVFAFQAFTGIDLATHFGFHSISPSETGLFNPIQILTYMFLHGGLMHIVSNMFGLYMFGPMLEQFLGSKRFLVLYIVSGIGACFLHGAINYYELSQLSTDSPLYHVIMSTPMIGASGAIFGMLGAFAWLFPNTEMIIFPIPIPIKAKYLVTLYALYEIYAGIHSVQPGVAHFAHIGGLIFGIALINFWNSKRDRFY